MGLSISNYTLFPPTNIYSDYGMQKYIFFVLFYASHRPYDPKQSFTWYT